MIRLEYLADKINELLGTDKYCVYLNSNAFPDDLGDRNVVVMNVNRVPFGFSTSEFNAESLTITLTFDLPCDAYGDDVYIRDGALAYIQKKLLGHQHFEVDYVKDDEYTVDSYFEMQPPGAPYVDSGRITQQIIISGSALVKSVYCGAIVGNDIGVYINGRKLLRLERSSSMQVGADNNVELSEDKVVPEMVAISKVCTKSITFLYTGKDIEKEFIKIAEGMPYDINKTYTYKVEYGQGRIIASAPFKITSVSVQDAPGVFLQYTVNMQLVEDAEET